MSEEYDPYGDKWEQVVMSLPKSEIVGMLRRVGKARCELLEALRAMALEYDNGTGWRNKAMQAARRAIAKAERRAES